MRALLVVALSVILLGCPSVPPVTADSGTGGGAGGGRADDGGTGGGSGGGSETSDAGSGDDAGAPFDAGLLADGGAAPAPHAALPADLAPLRHDVFATGRVCGECHGASATSTANRDELGRNVGLYDQWSASTMANAARDPLFRAVLAGEINRAPAAADAIAGVCLSCHSGMGRHAQLHAGATTTLGLVYAATNEGQLARDGVSCTLCHQVQPTNLGQDSSFSAGYLIGTTRQVFGPYAAPFATPMVNRTGFTPTEGRHVQQSALCGTCHALVTEALTPAGAGTGHQMGEQLTYLEWRRSAFSTEGGGATPASCQSCHMPDTQADGVTPLLTRLAHTPNGGDWNQLSPRGPFSRHTFVGANTLLPKLLRSGRALLNPPASDAALLEAEGLARDNLRTRAVRLSASGLSWSGGVLRLDVQLENLVGHKFPTGYPSRRAFLHLRALDAAGATLLEVGRTDGEGRLLGADGQPLGPERPGGGLHPHRARVAAADEVPVYESVMSDGHGGASYELLGAEGFLKDSRLLPKGHADSTTGPMFTGPIGVAGDADFQAGGDTVRFELPLAAAPARVEVRLEYQTFGPRYLDEVLARPSPEVSALRSMLTPGMLAPELVDALDLAVP